MFQESNDKIRLQSKREFIKHEQNVKFVREKIKEPLILCCPFSCCVVRWNVTTPSDYLYFCRIFYNNSFVLVVPNKFSA